MFWVGFFFTFGTVNKPCCCPQAATELHSGSLRSHLWIAWAMVLYVTSQEHPGAAGGGAVVALRPGNGSNGASLGLWRYVCCQRRPSLTLAPCRSKGKGNVVHPWEVKLRLQLLWLAMHCYHIDYFSYVYEEKLIGIVLSTRTMFYKSLWISGRVFSDFYFHFPSFVLVFFENGPSLSSTVLSKCISSDLREFLFHQNGITEKIYIKNIWER